MHVITTNFNGNPNIGLYGFCNNKVCLLGQEVSEECAKEIELVLKVPVHRVTVCGTSLIGVFVTGNDNKILLPDIAFDYEQKKLKSLGIDFELIKCHLTALGNNILCNENGALVNPEFSSDQKKRIRQALGVSLKPGTIAGFDTVGSLAVLNGAGCVVHRDITDEEADYLEDLLGINCVSSTVCMGSPYIASGVLCNDNGFVISDSCGGPEIVNIDESLGFLEK